MGSFEVKCGVIWDTDMVLLTSFWALTFDPFDLLGSNFVVKEDMTPGTSDPSFVQIGQCVLELLSGQTDRRTDRRTDNVILISSFAT